ncbi:hypothetical protein QX201_002494 [Fusarium graminearum]
MSELNSCTGTASSLLTALFYNLNMLKNLPNSRHRSGSEAELTALVHSFPGRLKEKRADGNWIYMCFLQSVPPSYEWFCINPTCAVPKEAHSSKYYCITIRPPMFGPSHCVPNYFHVPCFVKLAALTYLPNLHRLWPLNRLTYSRADMQLTEATREVFLDIGAEQLLQELKWRYYSLCQLGEERDTGFMRPHEVFQRFLPGIMYDQDITTQGLSTATDRKIAGHQSKNADHDRWNIVDHYLPDISFDSDLKFGAIFERWEEYASNRRTSLLYHPPDSPDDNYINWTRVNRAYHPEAPLPLGMIEWSRTESIRRDEEQAQQEAKQQAQTIVLD